MSPYTPKVALVTGASRGAGKGIARALGAAGMIVYVTGRSDTSARGRLRGETLPGTVHQTAEEITAAGGQGIAVICDHNDDAQTQALFERIEQEQGRLDILVNNAAFVHENLIDPGGFWEKPLDLVKILEVGLRSAYVCCYYAAPLMIRQGRGLITFTSSFGSSCYMHGPAYGAQKVGYDKFAADMAIDLEGTGVVVNSLWLGPMRTERTDIVLKHRGEEYDGFMAQAETPDFNGRVIFAIASDNNAVERSGHTLVSAEVAREYGVTDLDGRDRPSYRNRLGGPRIPHPAKVI
ncbi:SDR family NAD(P)-dependent oxidoreductase [Aestuariicella hydrocarbonica]|uniref:SDR family NAD(P)-dependent oxidoreductase n=1 Tax=Pseudomaricurvus hydrocarbonicus TaxID=1470433 RepID=A0A9E5JWA4_9GAMM|nr:SDR family NAD(P)-dependent oxidoreductase [Aestuariicella hydrocarbonica]NHO66055.1 SDR family NAD(P)-dependent oxidoreductase [Aestuariicella hydrocarbonica]